LGENFLTHCFYMVSGGVASRLGKPAAALYRRDAWDAGQKAHMHQERLHALRL
jgi:hypothetical protein